MPAALPVNFHVWRGLVKPSKNIINVGVVVMWMRHHDDAGYNAPKVACRTAPPRSSIPAGFFGGIRKTANKTRGMALKASFQECNTHQQRHFMQVKTTIVPAAIAAILWAPHALAQGAADRPIRIVVPYLAGGGVDTAARVVGQPLGEILGQPVVIDNRPGAATNIGSDIVAKSKPDGLTLLLVNPSQVANVSLYSQMPYDLQKDLAPVILIGAAPLILMVPPTLPVKNVKELIALAQSRPDQLNYASAGIGSPTHIAPELFKMMAGIRMMHVPYKGGSQAVVDLISGRVTMYFAAASTGLPLVNSGRARALGVTGTKRFAPAPHIPTVAEGGLPGYEITNWFALVAPAATPQEMIARLNAAANKALESPAAAKRLQAEGLEISGGPPDILRAFITREIDKYGRIIRTANIKPE
jgi:tripartite-type tricarboxylate transporter receptor subunit TctC